MNGNLSEPQTKTLNNLQQLLFRIYRIDKTKRTPDWHIARTDRPYLVFWYVLAGKKSIKINDIEYNVEQGQFVVFPSEVPFEILRDNNPIEHLEIALNVKFGPYNLMSLYTFPILTTLNQTEIDFQFIDIWEKLNRDWHADIKYIYKADHTDAQFDINEAMKLIRFNALTLDWFNHILFNLAADISSLLPTLDPRLQSLFYYINENLAQKFTLDELANHIFVSKSHLIHLFNVQIGMSPMEYIKNVKLQKAKELLLTSTLSIQNISKRIGYYNQSQFSRLFHQDTGVSPTTYRKHEHLF